MNYKDFSGEIRIRISDDQTRLAEWPERDLTFVDGRVKAMVDRVGTYVLVDMLGWTIEDVAAWTREDGGGMRGEMAHEVYDPRHESWEDFQTPETLAFRTLRTDAALHTMKCWPRYFRALLDGTKTFEIRQADRDFRVGDLLEEVEWDATLEPGSDGWGQDTGRRAIFRITYIMWGPAFGLEDGWVCMAIVPVSQPGGAP